MKKILVPTDFSKHADHALDLAISIAKRCNAEISILNALDYSSHINSMYPMSQTNGYMVSAYEQLIKASNEKLEERAKKVKTQQIKVDTKNEVGFLHDIVQKIVKESEVDLVVMGTKGVTGFKDLFLGSNTEKVVRSLEVPVLTVNEKITDFDLKKVLFVNEFEGDVVGDEFNHVINFAKIFDAEIHLLRINQPVDFMTTRNCMALMDSFAKKWKLENYSKTQYDHHFFEQGLAEASHLLSADVIAMGTHGRKGLAHVIYGSLTEDAVNHLNTPIFAFKIPKVDRKL